MQLHKLPSSSFLRLSSSQEFRSACFLGHLLHMFYSRFFAQKRLKERGLYAHAVTVVGYGTDRWVQKKLLVQHNINVHFYFSFGWDFWRIKNSWGTDKHEEGYFRVVRGVGHCGVGSYWMQPVCVWCINGKENKTVGGRIYEIAIGLDHWSLKTLLFHQPTTTCQIPQLCLLVYMYVMKS